MTRADAHRLLDEARAGLPISRDLITLALTATGDVEPDEWPVRRVLRPVGAWERPHVAVVARATPFDGLVA